MRAAMTGGAVAVAVMILALGGCGDSGDGSEPAARSSEPAVPEGSSPAPPSTPAPAPASNDDDLVAANQFRFNTDRIPVAAGEVTKLPFVNNDPAPHNISIYVTEGGKRLFKGKNVGDGERVTYRIPPLDKGRYYFVCDIHPVMEGTVVAR